MDEPKTYIDINDTLHPTPYTLFIVSFFFIFIFFITIYDKEIIECIVKYKIW
jgi:hypothetical protein